MKKLTFSSVIAVINILFIPKLSLFSVKTNFREGAPKTNTITCTANTGCSRCA